LADYDRRSLLFPLFMAAIHITDIEAAINHWREKTPSPDGVTLGPELRALAEVYALMVFHHEDEVDEVGFPPKAWAAWMAVVRQARPTRRALPSAPPARATTNAKAAAAASTRSSSGRP
jgi:hypothetical protein